MDVELGSTFHICQLVFRNCLSVIKLTSPLDWANAGINGSSASPKCWKDTKAGINITRVRFDGQTLKQEHRGSLHGQFCR